MGQRKKIEYNFTKEQFLTIVKDNLGVVTDICHDLNISRPTYYNYINSNEEIKKEIETINDVCVDFAERMLFKRIAEGSDSSIFYYLNNKGKKRGYNVKEEPGKEINQPPIIVINGNRIKPETT